MDCLARAGSAVAGWRETVSFDPDVSSHDELLSAVAERCRALRLPIRRVMWSGAARARRPWEREWLDARFLVPSDAGDLVLSMVLPEDAASPQRALGWWVAVIRAFASLVSPGDTAPARSVRFIAAWESGRARGRPAVPAAWQSFGRYQEIQVRVGEGGAFDLQAGGFAGGLLAHFATRLPGAELSWGPPAGLASVRFGGERAGVFSAQALLATALWWRLARFADVASVLSWLLRVSPVAFWQEVAQRLVDSELATETLVSHYLEARLGVLHTLAHALGNGAEGEEEAAGWCREIEVAIRFSRPELPGPGVREASAVSVRWPAAGMGFASKLDASRPYLGVTGFADPGAWRTLPGWSRWAAARLGALADGERSLAEIALRLMIEFGLDWEAAVSSVSSAVKEGRLVPLDRTLTSRTLLYFSYGSCMCRPSFRETIPRFELIGEAALKGFRLGFTHRSVARAGGVADVVPQEGAEVRGILYRIPWTDVPDLDEREGVRAGRYKREWVGVEALGVRYSNVLTYTVVNKHPVDIPPSPEYAGLISEGARGMLDPCYVESLHALFEQLGVEPELP